MKEDVGRNWDKYREEKHNQNILYEKKTLFSAKEYKKEKLGRWGRR